MIFLDILVFNGGVCVESSVSYCVFSWVALHGMLLFCMEKVMYYCGDFFWFLPSIPLSGVRVMKSLMSFSPAVCMMKNLVLFLVPSVHPSLLNSAREIQTAKQMNGDRK